MNKRITLALAMLLLLSQSAISQGFGIPSKKGGIGFGHLSRFTGIRFNFKDQNIEKVNGINVSVWAPKDDDVHTGNVNGISIGFPMAIGSENRSGINLGILGAGAMANLSGINIGGIGVGAGDKLSGINIGGIGVGAGGDVTGFNFGTIGVGSGGDIKGINIGGIGMGASGNAIGLNIGGIGVGAGESIKGINLALIGMGGSRDVLGFNFAGIGIGAGERMAGINVALVGMGAGESLTGLNIAGVGMGSPKVRGINIALAVGGERVSGITLAPAFVKVESGGDSALNGLSVSAVHIIKGTQRGLAVGVVNTTQKIKGFQLGLLNYVRDNPKGLRLLPVFNTNFGGRQKQTEG